MTLGLELLGAFLFGVGFTLIASAILIPKYGPRLLNWHMRRTLAAHSKQ